MINFSLSKLAVIALVSRPRPKNVMEVAGSIVVLSIAIEIPKYSVTAKKVHRVFLHIGLGILPNRKSSRTLPMFWIWNVS